VAITGRQAVIPGRQEDLLEHLTHVGVVVYDEDLGPLGAQRIFSGESVVAT
jgi:hypothetical protein